MQDIVSRMVAAKNSQGLVMSVRKRDGRTAFFDPSKIAAAVRKAFEATGEAVGRSAVASQAWDITAMVVSKLGAETVDIESIQDLVEDTLMNMGYKKTAKAYILYRAKRGELRDLKRTMDESLRLVDDYLSVKDWRVSENSNMSYSLQGMNAHISSTLTAQYWLEKIYPSEVCRAHKEGWMHIHDVGSLSSYCIGWDLEQLLINGFGGVSGKVESRPARHFRSALGQIVNFFYTLQGESAGAQAFSNFDTLLAPFIRYDGLGPAEVRQAIQEFVFNLNVPTRTGFQTPFTNITMDAVPPSFLKDRSVIIGGELKDPFYGDFQEEISILNCAFAQVMLEGDARGRPFTFPIPTYNITKNFDWGNPLFNPVWEMTARYGTPYFSNFINSGMSEEDARSMCCRLRLDNREIRGRGGIFAANPMTGSIGVVTINLPRLAFSAGNENVFREMIGRQVRIAGTSLEIKRKEIEDLTERGLYPYTRNYLEPVRKKTGRYWSNHFSTIGLIGMNEAFLNLYGGDYHSAEGKAFGERTLDFMLNELEALKALTGSLYNLEASPAESACYRLAKLDRKSCPGIVTSGTDDAPYYTNSVHLPASDGADLFDLLDHQDGMQSRFTGGTVVHAFVGEKIDDPSAVRELVRTIATRYRLPYFSITPVFSVCPVHGYIPGAVEACPRGHSAEDLQRFGAREGAMPTEVYSRIVGYYRPVSNWNKGKQREFSERKNFRISGRGL